MKFNFSPVYDTYILMFSKSSLTYAESDQLTDDSQDQQMYRIEGIEEILMLLTTRSIIEMHRYQHKKRCKFNRSCKHSKFKHRKRESTHALVSAHI